MNIKTSITTNGILLKKRLDELKNTGIDEISITLNTLNPKKFNNLCYGTKEQLNEIIKGIKLLKNIGSFEKNINLVINSDNLKEIPKIVEFCDKYNLQLRFIRIIKESTPGYVSPKMFFKYLKKEYKNKLQIFDCKGSYNKFKIGRLSCCFVNSACGENANCKRCNSSFFMRLTTDGKLKPCLISEKGETNLINYLKLARNNIENAINSKSNWRIK